MEFLTALLVLAVIALWVRSSSLKRRIYELERRMDYVVLPRPGAAEPAEPAAPLSPPPPPPPPAPGWEPAPHVPPMVFEAPPPVSLPPEPEVPPPFEPPRRPEPEPEREPEPIAAPAFSLADTLREKLSGEEWEALVGGSLLNKLGSLILVIAIALGLTYSATQLGPAGRVALALSISFLLIGGGVLLERRNKYLIFARGLLGGGWAALYLTAYAMHALDAARVIDNPLAAAIVLIVVAAGMILHSLRYRSQVVTGLAYFAAFAALGVTPVAAFSVVALVPLAASLLYLAWRFEWFELALFGVIATYGTCVSKSTGTATVAQTQAILGTYWLLFEIFDLLRTARRKPAVGVTAWIAPLNAAIAGVLSYVKWSKTSGAELWILFAGAGAVYLVDALLRARLRPPDTVPADSIRERALSGFEGPITLAAASLIPAILLGLTGRWLNIALLAEGEALFLGGLFFRQNYLRHLGAGAFLVSLAKLGSGLPNTPITVATAALFYLNRALKRPGLEYSYPAAALLAVAIGFEVPPVWLGIAWMGLALALFEFGFWTGLREFRLQGYGAAAVGTITLVELNAFTSGAHPWLTLLPAALGCWLVTAQIMAVPRLSEREHSMARDIISAAGTLYAAVLIGQVTPQAYLGLAWFALGILCFEIGRAADVRWFRTQGDITSAAGFATLCAINILGAGGQPAQQLPSLAGAAMLAYAAAGRLFRMDGREHRVRRDVSVTAATAFLAALCWYTLPSPLIAVAWGAIALLLVETGVALPFPAATANGHALVLCGIARLFAANFAIAGRTFGMSHRLLTVLPFAILCYYLYTVTEKARDRFARLYLYAGTALAVVLIRFELGVTIAAAGWAVFGVALLYFGLRLDKADLRRQSYGLAIWTFVRSWTTNFYAPESLLGVNQRVITGAIVIASFFMGEFLSPRGQQAAPRVKARTMFSVLATVLLTALLFYEVSGRLLTVAWGVEGIALLLTGFPVRERSLRLAGLALFFFCIGKLFLFDLRELETGYRILSFFVLGLLLLGASWVYTRFREQLKQYL